MAAAKSPVRYVTRPFPYPGTTSSDGVVAITTSEPGRTSSGGYCGNGPWFRRSRTGGAVPQS